MTLGSREDDPQVITDLKKAMKADLISRYQSPELQVLLNVATFIDPRYKELPFLDMANRSSIAVQVENELLGFEEDYSLE